MACFVYMIKAEQNLADVVDQLGLIRETLISFRQISLPTHLESGDIQTHAHACRLPRQSHTSLQRKTDQNGQKPGTARALGVAHDSQAAQHANA